MAAITIALTIVILTKQGCFFISSTGAVGSSPALNSGYFYDREDGDQCKEDGEAEEIHNDFEYFPRGDVVTELTPSRVTNLGLVMTVGVQSEGSSYYNYF